MAETETLHTALREPLNASPRYHGQSLIGFGWRMKAAVTRRDGAPYDESTPVLREHRRQSRYVRYAVNINECHGRRRRALRAGVILSAVERQGDALITLREMA